MHTTIAPSSLMVLMFTDIEGSVALKTRVGGAAYASMLARHDELFKKIIASCQGARIIQDTGDGFLARFATGSDAVNAALRFQVGLSKIAWEHEPLRVRIGLNLGEVQQIAVGQKTDDQSKVVGLPMDIAARLMGLASGGQILLTRTIFDDARQYVRELPRLNGEARTDTEPQPLRWMAHGQYLFKGSNEPMDVFEVGSEGLSPLRAPTDSEKARRSVALSDEETLGWRPAAGLEVPRRAGWSLVEKLGEGGFGEVWLGKHARTKESRVFKFCFDSDRLRSFKRELTLFRVLRDVLGTRSDISRLFEVQLEASPYFLETEFSEKGDLAEYAGALGGVANIPFEERLDIVARTADAVAAAHSVSVLHKDIKPSNILMYQAETGHVRPRLSDFGIGVLTDRSKLKGKNITVTGLTEEMLGSNQSSRTGTRMYAPPEMLREGGEFTMQGDVYALGVLLYQLAAGDLAKPLAPGWEHDIADPLLRQDIADCVAGDLSKRLDSAKALADRIRALPQRRALARRSKLLKFGAAASIALVVVAGLAAAWAVQEMNSRERAEKAERAAVAAKEEAETQRERIQAMLERDQKSTASLLLDFSSRIEPLEGSTSARQWLARAGKQWGLERLKDQSLEPRVAISVSRVLQKVTQIEGGIRGGGDGNPTAALETLTHADAATDRALAALPEDFDARSQRALLALDRATLLNAQGKSEEALKSAAQSLDQFEALSRERPDDPSTHRRLASAVQKRGDVLFKLKREPEALASYERTIEMRRHGLAQWGAKIETSLGQSFRRELSAALTRLANLKRKESPDEARRQYDESIALARELAEYAASPDYVAPAPVDDDEGGDDPDPVRFTRDLAVRLGNAAAAFSEMGDTEAADKMIAESTRLSDELLGTDPTNFRNKRDWVENHRFAGMVAQNARRWPDAIRVLSEAIPLARSITRVDPQSNHQRYDRILALLIGSHRSAGQPEQAAAVAATEIEWLESQLAASRSAERPTWQAMLDKARALENPPKK